MKSTDGELVTKTKTAHKALSTKAKAKKPKGGATTKKPARKKTGSVARKKTGDSKKTTQKKKRFIDDDAKSRRSDRNRNSSLNYEESTDPSEDEVTAEGNTRSGRRKVPGIKEKGRRKASNDESEANWEIYDQGNESDACWNEHYRRLQEFHSTHGHSGVPINWSAEPDFADWVSRQRQIFREVHAGYRIASTREEGRWKRLQVLRFPLNYEKWLWRRKYNELCEALNGGKYSEDTILPSPLREWVNHQKSSVGNGLYSRINSEQKNSLEKLGVITKDDTNQALNEA